MRYVAIVASLAGTLVFGLLILLSSWFVVPFAVCSVLVAIGVWDMMQTAHSLRRNYPILANLRFMLEKIRPEIRQYFLESDIDGTPFNRSKRALAALSELIGAAGLIRPKDLTPMHLLKRVSAHEVKTFAELYTFLADRELLAGTAHTYYAQAWNIAHAGSFSVLPEVKAAAEAQGQAA